MPLGSLAGVARVAMEVDTGTSEQTLAQFDRRFLETTNQMSEGAIKVELASRRLQRVLATYPASSDKALRATLALKAAQRSAAAETGTLAHRTRESGAAFGTFAHDVERAGFGIAVGSRAIHGLRSALFFSASGLAGFGLTSAIRASRDAALEQQVTLGQLQVALKDAGLAESAYAGRVYEALEASQRLGFSQGETARSFALAVRATKSVEGATRLLSAAQDVSRGSGRQLTQSTLLLTRAYEGQTGGLRRVGIEIGKHVKGYQAVAQAQAKFAGSAQTYANSAAGAQARLNVAIHTTEETIGTALLPTITSLNTRLANWLDNSRNQQRIQHDVNTAVREGVTVVHGFGQGLHAVEAVATPLNRLLGGTERTVKALGIALLALKLRAIAAEMGIVGARTRAAGAAAAVSAGEFNALAAAEGRAAAGGVAGAAGRAGAARLLGPEAFLAAIGGQAIVGFAQGVKIGDQNLPAGVSFDDLVRLKRDVSAGRLTADDRRVLRAYGVDPSTVIRNTSGMSNDPLHDAADRQGAATTRRRRRVSLRGQLNLAILRGAEASLTPGADDDVRALEDQARILRELIARDKNLAKKTEDVNQLDSVLSQIESIRQQRAQKIADEARKRAAARRRAEQAAERATFGTVTDRLQRFGATARLLAGRGQFNRERDELTAEERYLEQEVKNRELSVAHRRQLQARLDRVRQQIDDIGRQERRARQRAAAAHDQRQELLIQRQEAAAALTESKDDDLRAYRAEERLINRRLVALARLKRLTNQQLQDQTDLLQRKKSVQDQIKELAGANQTSNATARDLIETLQTIIQNESNVSDGSAVGELKQIKTHLYQSENHLRVIRHVQVAGAQEDQRFGARRAHDSTQAAFA